MNNTKKTRIARVASTLVIAASLASLSGCFGDTPQQSLAKAKDHLAKHETKAAVIELKNALQKDGKLAEARFLLGKTLLDAGQISDGLIEIGKARDAGYDPELVTALMASSMLKLGDVDRLIATYGETELKDPKQNAELKAALAGAYAAKRRMDQARSADDLALSADPDNISANIVNVRLLAASGDMDGATQALEALLKKQPDYAPAWVLKAELLQATHGNADAQLAAFRQALTLDKTNVPAHAGVLGLLIQRKDFDAARKQLAELQAVQPKHPQTNYFAALLAFESKDVKTANEQIQLALKAAPDSPLLLQLAAGIDMQRGAFQQAVANLSKVVQSNPNSTAVRVMLARAYLRSGDADKALAAVQPALDAKDASAEVYSVAAEVNMQQGKVKEAKALYAKALKLNPNDPKDRTALALVDADEGKGDQGADELRDISASDPGVTADIALVRLEMSKGEVDKALSALDKLQAKPNGKVLALTLRGAIFAQQGKQDQARANYEAAVKEQPTFMPAVQALAGMDMADKKVDQAVQRFENVLKVDPNNVAASMDIIRARTQSGMGYADLLTLINQTIKRLPTEPAPRSALIRLKLSNGQPKDAVQAAQEAVAAFPNNAALYDLLGQAQSVAGDPNQAILAFNQMASLQPNSAIPALRIAGVDMSRKDAPGAIAQLKRALDIQPDALAAQTVLASLMVGTGDAAGARAIARTIEQQRPKEPAGWALEGDIAAQRSEFPTAIAAYRASLAKRETADVAVKLHRILLSSGKTPDANAFETDWLARHPKDSHFQFYLGDVALSQSNYPLAQKRYLAVLDLEPNNAIVLNNLAWLAQAQGQSNALEYGEKALKLMPDSPPVLDTVAGIYAAEGKKDKALEMQKRAVTLGPNISAHRLHLAQYYVASGMKSDARAELKQLAALGDKFPQQAEVKKLQDSL